MEKKPPIFVVGCPRSGTTLLAAILSAHSNLDCGPETHFFRLLEKESAARLLEHNSWPSRAVSFLLSLRLHSQPIHELFGTTHQEINAFLSNRSPSVQAMLEALTLNHALQVGKNRWVEKTPNHLLNLETIRCYYPDSPIIRIVRDPRDVALSMRKLPWASQSPLANLMLCVDWDERSHTFFAADANTFTLQYEQLMADPIGQLHGLCNFIDEPFEEGMLDTSKSADRVISGNTSWWQNQVGQQWDNSRVNVWQREFPTELLPAAEAIGNDVLQRYQYPHSHSPAKQIHSFPVTPQLVEKHEKLFDELASQSIQLKPVRYPSNSHQLPMLSGKNPLLILGMPPMGATSWQRFLNTGVLLQILLKRRFSGMTTFWLEIEQAGSRIDRIRAFILSRLSQSIQDAGKLSKALTKTA